MLTVCGGDRDLVDLLPRPLEVGPAGRDHPHLRVGVALALLGAAAPRRCGSSSVVRSPTRSARPKIVFTARSFWSTVKPQRPRSARRTRHETDDQPSEVGAEDFAKGSHRGRDRPIATLPEDGRRRCKVLDSSSARHPGRDVEAPADPARSPITARSAAASFPPWSRARTDRQSCHLLDEELAQIVKRQESGAKSSSAIAAPSRFDRRAPHVVSPLRSAARSVISKEAATPQAPAAWRGIRSTRSGSPGQSAQRRATSADHRLEAGPPVLFPRPTRCPDRPCHRPESISFIRPMR